jgi:hypothetical protein
MVTYIASSFYKNVLKIVTSWSRFWIEFLNVFFLLLSIYYFITHCMEKYMGEFICIVLCILISSFVLCVKFHVACMHIKFCWCCLHHMKGWMGLVYSTVGWLLDWNSLITHNTKFWVFSISSLFVCHTSSWKYHGPECNESQWQALDFNELLPHGVRKSWCT